MHKINFKWIPYELSDKIREKRVKIANNLLNFFSKSSLQTMNKVLAKDETWIYLYNPRESMWIENGSEIPKRIKRIINSPKVMISVIWSRTGIKSISMLPPKQKFNKEFFEKIVLGELSQEINTQHKYFHCDNARPHLANEELDKLGMKRLFPYSPDLAPSDYFLFEWLKKLIESHSFSSENELFECVFSELNSIPKIYFQKAYE